MVEAGGIIQTCCPALMLVIQELISTCILPLVFIIGEGDIKYKRIWYTYDNIRKALACTVTWPNVDL
jgi:hypothetical protein